MTKLGKILVVFTVAASLAMLGFAAVTIIGGPNWEVQAAQIPGYTFERTAGETPMWEVTDSVTSQKVGQPTPVLAAAVLAAQKHRRDKIQADITAIDAQLPGVLAETERARDLIAKDIAALNRREELVVAELNQVHEESDALSTEGVAATQEATNIHNEVVRRREDVYRLEGELAAVRADKFRLTEQYKKLRDAVIRVRLVASTLEDRKVQLEQEVGPEAAPDAAPGAEPPYDPTN